MTDFAMPAPRSGSIDIYSGFQSQAVGSQLHKDIQAERQKRDPSYHSEVWCMQRFQLKNYSFDVAGKMDGIYRKEIVKIEEIKTAFDLKKLCAFLENSQNEHPYWLQLKTYGYFHWLKTNTIPELTLYLVSERNRKSIEMPITLNISDYETWLQHRLADLVEEVKESEKRIRRRKKIAKSLPFPFSTLRPGQKELMTVINKGMDQKAPVLIQAPTGLGKTMGILYPALHEALGRGQKVVYITPKNSQHQVALDAIKKFQKQKITSLTLTAKSKLCFKSQPLCNKQYCEFADNHYSKVNDFGLIELAKKENNLTRTFFNETGKKYQVCPYELQMECIPYADTVICDYNYVFGPASSNHRIGKKTLGERERPNLVIDEVHNLPFRGMDYYSPILSEQILEKMYFEIEKLPSIFQKEMTILVDECLVIIKNCRLSPATSHLINPPKEIFKEQETKLKEFVNRYLASDTHITDHDIVLALFNYWTEFTAALEHVNEHNPEFFTSYLTDMNAIKITCCDASKMLNQQYSNYEQIIGFSATVKPFHYYSQLIGLSSSELITDEFPSSFPKTKRKILIIPQISSKYSERPRNYSKIVDAIDKITALKPGNYFIFFPSFEFLNSVYRLYKTSGSFTLLKQTPGMKKENIEDLLFRLHRQTEHHLIFAVQGGALSEGMDYPGDMIVGAFVIGPPLPIFDWEREQMKKYYQTHYSAGFDYAYTYPAMAKAIQAAGRVIRSETDKGIIILIDDRFLNEKYAKCMPTDWFEQDPKELVSSAILNDIKLFWASEDK